MFDHLFRYPGVVRRHRDGPFAHERATYLASLATRGIAPETLLQYARYCLAVAHVVQSTPRDRMFTTAEVEGLAKTWAADRVQHRRAAAPYWPHQHFRAIAVELLKWLGRWTPPPKALRPYAREVDDFVVAERDRLRSPSTCRIRQWQIERFLSYLTQTNGTLATVTAEHVARARWMALFPFMNPTTCATACFGGIESRMWT